MSLLATVRRSEAVLVVVDIQERLSAVMERRGAILSATIRLVRTAGLLGMPIIATQQYPKGLGESEPALIEALAAAESAGSHVARIDKLDFDCFGEPQFVQALEATERRQIILSGMETHICVTQTALSALRAGYEVHVVADACCAREDAAHEIALARLRAAGSPVTTTESVMYEAVGRAGTDEFRALLGIVKG